MNGLGIDMVAISRMRRVLKEKRTRFLSNTFSPVEQAYCFSHKDPAPHFAGTFAAKEAVRKAVSFYPAFHKLEVRRAKNGRPEIWENGRHNSSILVSITHTDKIACAIAFAKKS